MTTVVGFVSEKGGTGKTTACYHIAVALARFHDKRVLVLDVDYQRGGITGRFFPDLVEEFGSGKTSGTTLFHKFQQLYSAGARSANVGIRDWGDGIRVVVSDERLSGVTADKLPSANNIRDNNAALLKHMQVINYVLDPLKESYDYILIDTHPEVSDVLRSTIYACDYCVSPVKFDRQSSVGAATIIGQVNDVNADVEMVKNNVDDDLGYSATQFSGSIGMMTREYGGNLIRTESVENRLRRTGGVFDNHITEGDGLRRALLQRLPVYEIDGNNAQRQANQFRSLTKEFMKKCP